MGKIVICLTSPEARRPWDDILSLLITFVEMQFRAHLGGKGGGFGFTGEQSTIGNGPRTVAVKQRNGVHAKLL